MLYFVLWVVSAFVVVVLVRWTCRELAGMTREILRVTRMMRQTLSRQESIERELAIIKGWLAREGRGDVVDSA